MHRGTSANTEDSHKDILALAQKLVAIRTENSNKAALEQALAVVSEQLSDFTIERFERKGVKSILVHNQKERPARFKVLLNGHLDVIPGKEEQYVPKIEGGNLYGAGALDMKSGLSCIIFAFKNFAKKASFPLGLQIVTDEEIGGFDGTKFQIEQGVSSDFVITSEATNLNIAHKSKGILEMRVTAKGTTAHGAYPWRGDNAIWKMHKFLSALKKRYPIPKKEKWVSTINVSNIQTNNPAFNKVPDWCAADFDIRFIPEDADSILKDVTSLVPDDFSVEVLIHEPAMSTPADSAYVRLLADATNEVTGKRPTLYGANGTSDARHYTMIGCEGVEFGPIGEGIGSDNENVNVNSVFTYYDILLAFLRAVK